MDILSKIVRHKRLEVERCKRSDADDTFWQTTPPPPRDFKTALRQSGMSAITEIKRRSPSKGRLRANVDVCEIARGYEQNGSAALSILTDREFFGGDDEDLQAARGAVALPVLRKDFTIDEYQIRAARQIGADAILLIARILEDTQISEFMSLARDLGMTSLVEVHDHRELERALNCAAEIIGINSRNLDTFEVDLETALKLKALIPTGRITVAESGIHTRADVERLDEAGFDAMLVGEALMRAPRPGDKLRELLGGVS